MRVSLCIPTSGVIEWVIPVIESIYQQNGVDENLFEVIVTDNGSGCELEKFAKKFERDHSNFIYKKTNSILFTNQIEALKLASGDYVKFVNHRHKIRNGALEKIIEFVDDNAEMTPIVFWGNGSVKLKKELYFYSCFDSFMMNLGHWITWSAGLGVWREDLQRIIEANVFNELFPHIEFYINQADKRDYIVNNNLYFDEIPEDGQKKGHYDLFYAFSVVFLEIVLGLFKRKMISVETFLQIKRDNAFFLAEQYRKFVIENNSCSYDLRSYSKMIDFFYSTKIIDEIVEGRSIYLEDYTKARVCANNMGNNSIVIFGACDNSENTLGDLSDNDVVCLLDNDKNKQCTIYKGIPVMSVADYKKMGLNYPVRVAVKPANRKVVLEQLKNENIDIDVFSYV